MGEGDLQARLDAPLPGALEVGAGTAVFVAGWCFSALAGMRSLTLMVDGEPQSLMAHGMPRLDVLRALEDPHAYRSGFWGLARIGPRAPGATCRLALRARLEDGAEATSELANIPVAAPTEASAPAPPPAAPGDESLVAICMATYDPPLDLFRRQVDSIRAQTHGRWACVISDDCSDPERFDAVRAAVADDPRFLVSRSPGRLGFYRNFERALELAPPDARYVAMADQDDAWYPEKLATLLLQIGDAQLVYSDARVIDRDGRLISDTYWSRRRNNHSDLLSLLVANAVTGAASLFRAEVLEDALPFPPAQFAHFHDHWVALTALARGDIAFVDRPLYDYVQHGQAALGHAAATRMPRLRSRLGALRRDRRERVRMWRLHYFVDGCRLLQYATILDMRCGPRMTRTKRRSLRRFLRVDRRASPLVRLALRGLRELVGRPQTLGAEWMLFRAFAWRRLLAASARNRPSGRLRMDAVPPPALDPQPGRRVPRDPAARTVAEKIAPLTLAVRDDAPPRVNVLIPTMELEHFFGGYIAKLNLARRLAERGARVRIVTVDPVGPLPRDWRRRLESYAGLAGLFDRVEVGFGRESQGLEVSRSDRFVATTWWTAHGARHALEALGGSRFLYLIQEYEPFTFPMGTFAALARESYRFPHVALFSSELLRDYFRRHQIGVYAGDAAAGDRESAAFENALTPIDPPAAAELAGRRPRQLLLYARPESHAARNMYELGVLALSRALEQGAFDGWSLHGIGTVGPGRRVDLGGDAELRLLPRSGQADYASLLRQHDVGLALMYTPHPSLVPLEMASAGMLAVTNSFENKTAPALGEISSNLIVGEPTIEGVAGALCEAEAASEDVERRVRRAAVRWSRDWDESFDDRLLDRLSSFLET